MAGLKGMTAKYACTRIRMAKILRGIRCPNPRYTVKEHVLQFASQEHIFGKYPNNFGPCLVRNILHLVPLFKVIIFTLNLFWIQNLYFLGNSSSTSNV